MFTKVNSFSVQVDGRVERRQVETPSIINPAPLVIRMVSGLDKHEALRLLRRFVDELEAMP
jgi:hypothetical protein